MEYHPSAIARALSTGRMNTLGLAVLHQGTSLYDNSFHMTEIDGILLVTTHCQQSTMLCTFQDWKETEQMPQFFNNRCDGFLLLIPPAECALPQILRDRKIPFVIVSGRDASGQATSVDVDNVRGAFEMTQYLLGLGHRRIAYVSHPWDRAYPFWRERREGFRQAMADAGQDGAEMAEMSPDEILALDWSAPARPTAALCCYDNMAIRLIEDLTRQGGCVPGNISLAGFDDLLPAAGSHPALTTMRQPMRQIGIRAAELLLAQLSGEAEAGHQELLPTELIVRDSTAPPPIFG